MGVTVSLEDHFNAIEETAPQCGTCRWYVQLEPKDQAFFDNNQKVKAKLWRACTDMGLQISYTSFRDHLNNRHEPLKCVGAVTNGAF